MAELGRGKAREKVDGEQRRRAVPNSFTVSVLLSGGTGLVSPTSNLS